MYQRVLRPRAARVRTFRYRLGENPVMRVFHGETGASALHCLAVATAVFELEKQAKGRKRIERLAIGLPKGPPSEKALQVLARALADLVRFTLIEEVDFEFRRTGAAPVRKLRTKIDLTPAREVCLFSGGVDSYVGLTLAARRYPGVNAIFCAHQDQSKINRLVNQLFQAVFAPLGIPLRQLSVPDIGKGSYAQLRGFLYFVSTAAWMHLLGASTLIVSECGPTMYQPKFGPLDRVTMTTHPYVVGLSKQVIELLLGRKVQIILPFEDLTKAEVMALGPRRQYLAQTHSCISQRFVTGLTRMSGAKADHDGTCYGCVIRRLAALAAGVQDGTRYAKDPLCDVTASRGNLLALLRFCLDYLDAPGGMEEYEVGEIEAYGKQDLFRRFALDNFAGVHRLVRGRRSLAHDVQRVYGYCLEVLRGTRVLDERLADLAARRFLPAFPDTREVPKLQHRNR